MAATLQRRVRDPEAPWDPRIEPLDRLVRRWRLRRTFRHLWGRGADPAVCAAFAAQAGLAGHHLAAALRIDRFGEAWEAVVRQGTMLSPAVLPVSRLEGEIAAAEARLERLLGFSRPSGDQADRRAGAPDGPAASPAGRG